MMSARGDVRVAASHDVGVHANRGRWAAGGSGRNSRGFAQEQFKLGAGLDIENQNPDLRGALVPVAESFADFVARLAHAGKDDACSPNADAAQTVEFAA